LESLKIIMEPDMLETPEKVKGEIASSRCLVTGGAGFIGSNLTRTLLAAGARVTVLDNLSTGQRAHLPSSADLKLVEGDLASYAELGDLVHDIDYVFHLAAQVGNVKSIADPVGDASANVLGSVRLLQACRETRVRKIVYSGSSATFGEAQRLPIDERHPQNPVSPYALSKLTAERYMTIAAALWEAPAVTLRYFNVYGLPIERNEYTGVISIFFERLAAGQPLVIYGDGEQCRDFVFVRDVVQANVLAAVLGRGGDIYNIGTGVATTIRRLADAVMTATGRRAEVRLLPARAGEVQRSVADITHARAELAFAPAFSLAEGLQAMWKELSA
jgi:UDP-glucose 4-epimerase